MKKFLLLVVIMLLVADLNASTNNDKEPNRKLNVTVSSDGHKYFGYKLTIDEKHLYFKGNPWKNLRRVTQIYIKYENIEGIDYKRDYGYWLNPIIIEANGRKYRLLFSSKKKKAYFLDKLSEYISIDSYPMD